MAKEEQRSQQSWQVVLVVLTISAVFMAVSYTMLIPFLPVYLTQELHVPADKANFWSGLIFSMSFLISGIMAPVWGAIADKKSRKLMAVRAAFLLAISYGLGGIVQNEWQLLMMRAFQGFAAGLWPACLAIMASYAPQNRIGFCMGIMQGAMTAGGVLGPLAGGTLAHWFGMRMAFFLGAAFLFLITVLLIVMIKEPPRKNKSESKIKAPKRPSLLRNPVVFRMLVAAGIAQLSLLLVQPIMPQYIEGLSGHSGDIVLVTGILFSIVGLSGVFAAPVWGMISQKVGFRPALYTALFGAAVFNMIQALPESIYGFGAWRFVGGLMFAGVFPAINSILTMSTGPDDRGKIFGLSYAAQQIGNVIGPIVGGAIGMALPLHWVIFLSGFVLLPIAAYLWMKRPTVEVSTHGNEAKLHKVGTPLFDEPDEDADPVHEHVEAVAKVASRERSEKAKDEH